MSSKEEIRLLERLHAVAAQGARTLPDAAANIDRAILFQTPLSEPQLRTVMHTLEQFEELIDELGWRLTEAEMAVEERAAAG